jgi:hypothetical protein
MACFSKYIWNGSHDPHGGHQYRLVGNYDENGNPYPYPGVPIMSEISTDQEGVQTADQ